MYTAKDGKVFKNKSDGKAYERLKGLRDVTEEDVNKALEYMREHIPCRDFEKSCGTHIGCSTCPYEHFKWTVMKLIEKFKEGM